MLPIIVGVVVLVAIGAGSGAAVYKRRQKRQEATPPPKPLGKFAVWGRPNAGKTTFISRFVDPKAQPGAKEQTTSRRTYTTIPPFTVDTNSYQINEITDMPGTRDRLKDWLALVASHEHIFYILNFARRNDAEYRAGVRADLQDTTAALADSSKSVKRLHIIASHVDQSHLADEPEAEVHNKLQADPEIQRFCSEITGVDWYVYAVNLTDGASFKRLRDSIVRDLDFRP